MRRKLLIVILFLALLICSLSISAQLADTPWPTYRGNMKRDCLSPYTTDNQKPHLKWKFDCENGIESSPVIGSDGTVYFGSWDNHLYAIDGVSGFELEEDYGDNLEKNDETPGFEIIIMFAVILIIAFLEKRKQLN